MGRNYARLLTTIWSDEAFRKLSVDAQWLYFLLLTQPNLSSVGVVPFTPRRWANYARGGDTEAVIATLAELAEGRFVLHDDGTEEVMVRSFLKHDRVLENPNMLKTVRRDFDSVLSEQLRGQIREAMEEGLPEGVLDPLSDPLWTESPTPSTGGPTGGPTGGEGASPSRAVAAATALTPTTAAAAARAERPRTGDVFSQAIELLLLRFGKAETALTKDNPGAWLASIRGRLRAEHRDRAEALLAARPGLTGAELADALVPSDTPKPRPMREHRAGDATSPEPVIIGEADA